MNIQHDGDLPKDVRGYHRRTKHAPTRYALGPAFLDWTSQPSPYRLFVGSRQITLPLRREAQTPAFPGAAASSSALDMEALGLFLELAFGISAWKSGDGATWALRNNPSSGNLHPTEAYLVLPALTGLADSPGLYHYAPQEHVLEERAAYAPGAAAPPGGFLLALSSIPWREAWKYGERAFRYCQLDAGHAVGAAAQAAAALGWTAEVMAAPSDNDIAALLGLGRPDGAHRREPEHPDLLMWIGAGEGPPEARDWRAVIDSPRDFHGAANRLSEDHDGWPLVDLAAEFCRKSQTEALAAPDAPLAWGPTPSPDETYPDAPRIAEVVRRRRSAQKLDGQAVLPAAWFRAMLAALAPGARPLLSALPWPAALTPVLFAHRVEGLEPGLYALERNAEVFARFRVAASQGAAAQDFEWAPAEPFGAPLYRLRRGPVEKEATRLSCLQPIAGKGCFSLAMIADFDQTLDGEGGFGYRRLHWEAGLIGQALYLWATAAGLSGTGIGCFFDDDALALLGLRGEDLRFQDIYHFTVGAPVEDVRILTLPAYPDQSARD